MTRTFSYDTNEILSEIEKLNRLQKEQKEQTLAEIITKYDFIVGSKEVKFKLMEILPEGATIISSPYIENPTTVYAIKKFDMTDLFWSNNGEDKVILDDLCTTKEFNCKYTTKE